VEVLSKLLITVNDFAIPIQLEINGRARLLPSQQRFDSVGALYLPSQRDPHRKLSQSAGRLLASINRCCETSKNDNDQSDSKSEQQYKKAS